MNTRCQRWIREAYRAMLPVREIVTYMQTECKEQWMTLAFQEEIMHSVVHDEVCDKFPPHHTYIYRFLKTYMNGLHHMRFPTFVANVAIEQIGVEAHEELISDLMEHVLDSRIGQDTLNAEDMHHVSYTIPTTTSTATDHTEELVLTCRVASVFNEVGLKLWEAAWFLAEYILTHRQVFHNHVILELGAGVGFTGLVVAAITTAKRVILSDYAPNVMQNLRYNVEINAPKCQQCPVDVVTLDWDTWNLSNGGEESATLRPTILLAGDCVYDVASFPSLVRVLQIFLGAGTQDGSEHTQGPPRMAIFASTVRNQKTFQAFLDQLEMHAISYEDITGEAQAGIGDQLFTYSNRDQIRLCRLSRAN